MLGNVGHWIPTENIKMTELIEIFGNLFSWKTHGLQTYYRINPIKAENFSNRNWLYDRKWFDRT